jgi:hypothetical protein
VSDHLPERSIDRWSEFGRIQRQQFGKRVVILLHNLAYLDVADQMPAAALAADFCAVLVPPLAIR